jgi:hypothetical protein
MNIVISGGLVGRDGASTEIAVVHTTSIEVGGPGIIILGNIKRPIRINPFYPKDMTIRPAIHLTDGAWLW